GGDGQQTDTQGPNTPSRAVDGGRSSRPVAARERHFPCRRAARWECTAPTRLAPLAQGADPRGCDTSTHHLPVRAGRHCRRPVQEMSTNVDLDTIQRALGAVEAYLRESNRAEALLARREA